MTGRIDGKVALITAAGSGIGRAVAVRLAEEGAQVVVTSRSPAHVEETSELVRQAVGEAPTSAVLDVTDDGQVRRTIEEIAASLGRIDILSHNAGIELSHAPPVTATTDDDWARVLDANLTGAFQVSRAAIPHIPSGGSIVMMASMNSYVSWPNNAAYSASKGGLLQFTRALSLELAPKNVRANCVCPGIIQTPLTQAFIDEADDPERLAAEYRAVSPFGRMGTPEEVANAVLFLASDESSFVTGTGLVIDGGTTVAPV
jgi:NAD(P)-dependent dehydrogenase (short-subunit alcohol dehydrogenase family)